MQGGWQPPPGGGGYGGPPPGGGYGGPPPAANPYASPGAAYGGAGMMNYGNYEFSDMENQIIDKAAGRARTWGIISIVLGALQLLGTLGAVANPGFIVYLPQGIIAIIIGTTFLGAGNSLKAVVETQGNDIPHMMTAVQKLGSAFFIQIVVTIIGVVLVALALVLVFFIAAASALSK